MSSRSSSRRSWSTSSSNANFNSSNYNNNTNTILNEYMKHLSINANRQEARNRILHVKPHAPNVAYALGNKAVPAFANALNGGFGSVMVTTTSQEILHWFTQLGLDPIAGAGMPPLGSPIAIKIIKPSSTPSDGDVTRNGTKVRHEFVERSMNELKVHLKLAASPSTSQYVPAVYFGGYSAMHGCSVIVMRGISATSRPLDKLGKKSLTPTQYFAIERAVHALWKAGIHHGDLHGGNIFIDNNNRVTIIDFGSAVDFFKQRIITNGKVLSRSLKKALQARPARGMNKLEVFSPLQQARIRYIAMHRGQGASLNATRMHWFAQGVELAKRQNKM